MQKQQTTMMDAEAANNDNDKHEASALVAANNETETKKTMIKRSISNCYCRDNEWEW